LINTITLSEGYDPETDEWENEITIRDADSIGTHKSRGRGELEVTVYSTGRELLTRDQVSAIGVRLFGFMAADYATVTVRVPLACFGFLVGSTVLLTSPRVPNGDGTRGVTNRRCIVVGRRWPLDPEVGAGELTLWMLLDELSGYTPSAQVTGQSNTSGDTWDITCDTANALNIRMSSSGDGQALDSLLVNDRVRVITRDATSATTMAGVVDAVDSSAGTITVTFSATWTPGASSWILEPGRDDDAQTTTAQKQFCYVGGTDHLLDSDAPARVMA